VFIGAYFLTLVLNYIFGVSLSWFLTPSQFGILGVAQSLLLLIALAVGSGFAWTTNHDLAVHGLDDQNRRRFRTSFLVNIALGTLVAILLWVSFATGLLPLGVGYDTVIPLIGLTAILLSARAVLNGAARGLYRFNPVAINLVGEVIIKILFGVLAVALGAGVGGVMLGFAIGAGLSLLHSLWITRKENLWLGNGWFERRVLRDTAPVFVGMISTALMLNLDVLGLKLLAPAGQGDLLAGYYQAAVILSRAPVFIAQAITLVIFTYVAKSSQAALTEIEKTDQSLYLSGILRTWFRLLLPVSLILILSPRTVLSLFFPPEYIVVAPALRVAGLGTLLLALVTLINGYLQAVGDRRSSAKATGLATILQVLLMILLVPSYGIMGAAVSLLIASAVGLLALLPAAGRFIPIQASPMMSRLNQITVQLAPLMAFILPLVLLPEVSAIFALVKLGIAGVLYVSFLMILQWQPPPGGKQPARYFFTEFIRVFLGG
ncbi:MAG: oligosaccharide flippase family protein, partial [Anaerolineales bacterium]